ncbi:MAG: hypothetical protein COA57_03180 [Flavobacteriales bacterium]|nr:MAG: hypothetical protein COA57_03180 [Flavobacteriales bacterium]
MHIGNKIRELVKEKGLAVTEFAKKINYSRRNAYVIFSRKSIDTAVLKKIGEVLEYDFFKYYIKEDITSKAEEPAPKYNRQLKDYETKIEALSSEIKYLKEINDLLKEKLKKKK